MNPPRTPEESLDPKDWAEMRRLGHRMVDDAMDYLERVRERPVWRPVPEAAKKALRAPLPIEGKDAATVYEEFRRDVFPHAMGNIHPRFWGWVIGTGTPFGALADLMASTMNPNIGGGEAPLWRGRKRGDGEHRRDRSAARAGRSLPGRGPLVPRGRRVRSARRHRARRRAAGSRPGARRFPRVRSPQMDVRELRGGLRAGPVAREASRRLRLARRLSGAPDARASGGSDLVQRVRRPALARVPRAQGLDVDPGARRREVRPVGVAELRPGKV